MFCAGYLAGRMGMSKQCELRVHHKSVAASTNPSFSDPIPLLAIHVHVHSGDALGRAVDGLTSVCEVTSREGRCELTANPPLGPNGQPRKGRAYWESDTAWGEADSLPREPPYF